MERNKKIIINIGAGLFLAGIALLIVRNNNYPWPLKRASDILFLVSFLSVFLFAFIFKEWVTIKEILKKPGLGLGCIFGGLILSSSINYFMRGAPVNGEGVLVFGRFIEVIILMFLTGFFISKDEGFYKKVAVAQLSTLVYLGVFLIPNQFEFNMPRFSLLENWPSNVGYYLIISLALILVFIMEAKHPFKKIIALYGVAFIGFSGILLWAQSRASWLAFCLETLIILLVWPYRTKAKRMLNFILVGTVVVIFFVFGFIILPSHIKTEVLTRIFPSLRNEVVYLETKPQEAVGFITSNGILPNFFEPSRPELWKKYSKFLFNNPEGSGVSYDALTYEGTKRGPHNTFLEIMVLGGLVSLLGFIWIFYLGFKNIIRAMKSTRPGGEFKWPLYVFASLFGFLVVSFFDNMSTFRLMWIVLALGIFFPNLKPIKEASARPVDGAA